MGKGYQSSKTKNFRLETFFYRDVADIILDCDLWIDAMKSDFPNPVSGIKNTPLRLLIKMFPDLAKKVFDKCTTTNLQQIASDPHNKKRIISSEDERFKITFNYELLDDSYTLLKTSKHEQHSFLLNLENFISTDDGVNAGDWSQSQLYDDNDHLVDEAKPYTGSSTLRKLNHPLMIMAEEARVVRPLVQYSYHLV